MNYNERLIQSLVDEKAELIENFTNVENGYIAANKKLRAENDQLRKSLAVKDLIIQNFKAGTELLRDENALKKEIEGLKQALKDWQISIEGPQSGFNVVLAKQ